MIPLNKLLKIALPVTTATATAIITSYLIALQHKDLKKLNEEDQLLENIEAKTEEFKEEKIEQSEDQEKTEENERKNQDKEAEKNKEQNETAEVEKSKEKDQEKLDINKLEQITKDAVEKALHDMKNSEGAKEVDQMQMSSEDVIKPEANQSGPQEPSANKEEKNAQSQEQITNPSVPPAKETQSKEQKLDSELEEKAGPKESSDPEPLDSMKETDATGTDNKESEPEEMVKAISPPEEKNQVAQQEENDSLDSGENTRQDVETTSESDASSDDSESSEDGDENYNSQEGEDGNSDGNAETDNLDIEEMKSLLDSLGNHKDSLGALLARFSS